MAPTHCNYCRSVTVRRFAVDFVRITCALIRAAAAAAADDGRIKDEREIDTTIRALNFFQRLHKNRISTMCTLLLCVLYTQLDLCMC